MKLPLRTREVASALALILVGMVATPDASAQNRDLNTERLLLDDAAGDGTRNTLLLQVPPTGLGANRVLTFPDAGGTVMTGAAPLAVNRILFGGPAGQTAQSANLLWDNTLGIFNIGAGNFTVTAATGNTSIAGTLTADGATTLGDDDADGATIRGQVNINNANAGALAVNINTSAFAHTTTVGNNTASNTVNIASPVVNVPNLPAGASSNALVTTDGTALYETPAATALGTTAWLIGGNAFTAGAAIRTMGINAQAASEDDLALMTDGVNRLLIDGTTGQVRVVDGLFRSGGGGSAGRVDIVETAGNFAASIQVDNLGSTNRTVRIPNSGVASTYFILADRTAGQQINTPLDVNGDLDVGAGNFTVAAATGNTGIAGTLSVTGATTIAGAVDAQTTGNAIGDGTDATQLTVDGFVGGAVDLQVNGDLDVTGTLTTNGFSSGVGGFTLSGDLDVNGNDIVDNTDGDVTILENLVVTGNVNPSASLTYTLGTDALRWNDAYIGPASLHVGPSGGEGGTTEMVLSYSTVSNEGMIVVDGSTVLEMSGTATDINTSLNVDGNLDANAGVDVLAGDLTVGSPSNFTVVGASGNTTIAGTLNVSGVVTGDGSGLTSLDATDLTGDVPTASLTTNVVAAVNGSAGFIDAARIGIGLTDAQVNNALTISGGTITSSPITNSSISGSTGSFTTITGTALPALSTATDVVVSNAGALETRTIASLNGSIGVSTDATLTGDGTTGNALGIDLSNPNTWTGAQTFSSVDVNGGTIDGTAIGGASASTGAFTTVTTTGSVTVNDGANADLVITEGGFDRSSIGAEVIRLDNSDATGTVDVLINGATQTTNSRLTVNEGHWTSQGTAPTAAGDGTNLAAAVTVAGNATDVAGSVSATAGGTAGLGVITVTFAVAYSGTPFVVVTPANANAGNSSYYISNVTTTAFNINIPGAPGDNSTVYDFHYQVIEGN